MINRYFEYTKNGSNKFWEISWEPDKASFTVRWGPIGSKGICKTKTFSSTIKASAEYQKIILSKIDKGYKEKHMANKEESQEIKKLNQDYLEIW